MAKEQKPFIYKGSYGFKLHLTLDPDKTGKLADATNFILRIKPPTGVTVDKELTDANIVDVTIGKIFYDVVDGDFDLVGDYQLEVIDVTPGRYLPTEIKKLAVKDTL
jgi:hypothetical protein